MTAELSSAPAVLFRPQTAWRVRWNMNTDTPLPPDEAAGENPPDGAMIDYYVGAKARGELTLEVKDEKGNTVRRYSSTDPVVAPDATLAIPRYWVRPSQQLSSEPGMHRFLWDLHYTPIPGAAPQYPIAAVYMNTAPASTSPWAMPGKYTAVLTIGGKSYSQPFSIAMDPRVKTSTADLSEQFKLSRQIYDQLISVAKTAESARQVREQLDAIRSQLPEGELKKELNSVTEKMQLFGGTAAPTGARTLGLTTGRLRSLFAQIEGVDLAPTSQIISATAETIKDAHDLEESWKTFASADLPALNSKLKAAGLATIKIPN